MTNSKFNPKEHISFAEGSRKVQAALKETGVNIHEAIITSREKAAVKLVNLLKVDNIPGGFKKWQLPIVLESSQLFISIAQPDIEVPEHSHDEGDGIRIIMSGSVIYNGVELTAGDWMFIPKGKPYSIKIGPFGASMCYCYCCSCAGSVQLNKKDWVINPATYIR
jgi:hypothetical protein